MTQTEQDPKKELKPKRKWEYVTEEVDIWNYPKDYKHENRKNYDEIFGIKKEEKKENHVTVAPCPLTLNGGLKGFYMGGREKIKTVTTYYKRWLIKKGFDKGETWNYIPDKYKYIEVTKEEYEVHANDTKR